MNISLCRSGHNNERELIAHGWTSSLRELSHIPDRLHTEPLLAHVTAPIIMKAVLLSGIGGKRTEHVIALPMTGCDSCSIDTTASDVTGQGYLSLSRVVLEFEVPFWVKKEYQDQVSFSLSWPDEVMSGGMIGQDQ